MPTGKRGRKPPKGAEREARPRGSPTGVLHPHLPSILLRSCGHHPKPLGLEPPKTTRCWNSHSQHLNWRASFHVNLGFRKPNRCVEITKNRLVDIDGLIVHETLKVDFVSSSLGMTLG